MSRFLLITACAAAMLANVALAVNDTARSSGPRRPRAARPGSPTATPANPADFFTSQVRPLLESKCVSCHSGEKQQGGLRLTTRDAVLKGGASGPAVDPKGGKSLLLDAVNYRGRRMPPQGQLSPKDIATLTRWVAMGTPWATGEHASLEPKGHTGPPRVTPETMKFWSFQPVRRPEVPSWPGVQVGASTVRLAASTNGKPGSRNAELAQRWVRSPVDAFLLKRLEAAGLAPNGPAAKEALLRRATYDLTGLPPTPQEVEQFVNDASPNAWEKVVDRLLASPHYGEKWGRHWLDLVRYAETNSYERDGDKPFAWRYRDYVINAFNQDKPYDQFVLEQLAGDELPARSPEKLIATGYYRLGIWDDEPVDGEQALYDDLDDIASTTGQVFLGLTIGCARCHDHKLDPIPQKDYYRFLSFFNGIHRLGGPNRGRDIPRYSLRPLTPELEQQQREQVTAHEEKLRRSAEQIAGIESKVLPDLIPVEREDWRTEARRPGILKERVPRLLSQADFDRYLALREERKTLERNPPSSREQALCVKEVGPEARETCVLLRGSAQARGEKVEPGFLTVLAPPAPQIVPPPGGESSGRRLALARWIASEQNPLAARVIANRVWQYHFGRGLVRSSSNFGFQGDRPTHPELLDWLASEVVRQGWHLKPLHKLIMMSSAYQMSSRANPAALAKDPENDLFWRFDMRRLEAEEVRDSILAVNGSLNPEMGGPSIFPTVPAEVLAGQSIPGAGWGRSTPEQQRRRSVYVFVKRSLMMPILAAFDGPEPDLTCAARFATTQPTQALGMLNSTFLNEQARVFAQYLRKQAGDGAADQVRLCLTRTLQRRPTSAEVERGVSLLETLRKDEKAGAEDAVAAFCVVALNLNEFMYLD